MEKEKKCKQCLITKERKEFRLLKSNKDGLFGRCKECMKANERAKRNNPEFNKPKITKAPIKNVRRVPRQDKPIEEKKINLVDSKRGKYYVNPKELYYEMIVGKSTGRASTKLSDMFILIVNGVSRKFRYLDSDLEYDCYSSGLEKIFDNWMEFNEEKSRNAFAYLTEIVKRGFAFEFNRQMKQSIVDGIPVLHFNHNSEHGEAIMKL